MYNVCFFFFFQAEDGIRDGRVTGVQTCALPISEAGAGDRLVGPSIRGGTDPATQLLDLAAPRLAFEALSLRASGRAGRPALARNDGRARDELVQPGERFLAVALEAAVLLRLDDEDALAADALVARAQKAPLDRLGQRRRADVEAQMHGRGHLVDVLAARALRADRADFDFRFRDRDRGGSVRHGPLFCLAAGSVACAPRPRPLT